MTILQAQEAFTSLMLSLKANVDKLNLTPSPENTPKVPKVSQVTATKPDQTVKNQNFQSEPPPSILKPTKTTKPKSKKTPTATLQALRYILHAQIGHNYLKNKF
ncbi:hypothetical protein O181_013010 [Austropuccinia psidii MF-1]|uniref:Uncharacterized protein n=1 Tax=Austropuccinia psidii MF-1 TaxID=1389203 RepID=A0A9Q3BZ08_9BASI|nr:hypothetical protein [Austropuccinia psidii MF-1]